MTFPELNNRHAGRPAVIIGKGPSLDAWMAAGCPQPEGAVRIGVNHAGGAVRCDWNVSVHSDQPEMAQIPGHWLQGIMHGWNKIVNEAKWLTPPGARLKNGVCENYMHHWMLCGHPCDIPTNREWLAEYRWFWCDNSSAQPAIQLAWYLGCTSLLLVGIDGGTQQAAAALAVPGGKSPAQNYERMRHSTYKVAKTLFPFRWKHWEPGVATVPEFGQD